MGLLDSNRVKVTDLSVQRFSQTDVSVASVGGLLQIRGLKQNVFKYAAIIVKTQLTDLDVRVKTDESATFSDNTVLRIVDEYGRLSYNIKKAGIYYIDASSVDNIVIYNQKAIANGTISFSVEKVIEMPSAFLLKPIQNICQGSITLSAGETSKPFYLGDAFNEIYNGVELARQFRFVVAYVRYKANGNIYTAKRYSIVLGSRSEYNGGYVANIKTVASTDAGYHLESEWVPLSSPYLYCRVDFESASEGDVIDIEIRGIR